MDPGTPVMSDSERWDRIWSAIGAGVLVAIGTFAAGDFERERDDIAAGRTHMTGTTASSSIRRGVARLGHRGPLIFCTSVLSGSGAFLGWFLPHIISHLDSDPVSLQEVP